MAQFWENIEKDVLNMRKYFSLKILMLGLYNILMHLIHEKIYMFNNRFKDFLAYIALQCTIYYIMYCIKNH